MGEAGVRAVGVVPQLGILGVVTPGVTGSARILLILILMLILIIIFLLSAGRIRVVQSSIPSKCCFNYRWLNITLL